MEAIARLTAMDELVLFAFIIFILGLILIFYKWRESTIHVAKKMGFQSTPQIRDEIHGALENLNYSKKEIC